MSEWVKKNGLIFIKSSLLHCFHYSMLCRKLIILGFINFCSSGHSKVESQCYCHVPALNILFLYFSTSSAKQKRIFFFHSLYSLLMIIPLPPNILQLNQYEANKNQTTWLFPGYITSHSKLYRETRS
jgi:hypothetical protein